jgi:hypothetical protein
MWKLIWDIVGQIFFVGLVVCLFHFPFLVYNLIRLNRRLDIFVRIEEAAEKAAWKPEEFRETMAKHEKALADEKKRKEYDV